MPNSLFFALHMQCIIKVCTVKLIKFILNICIFGGFHAPKRVCFRGYALATGPYPRSSPLFSAFGLNFWRLGASSLLVTPISGYGYVRVSKK